MDMKDAYNLGAGVTKLDYFSMDFWDEQIIMAKKVFPAGYFATEILNFDKQLLTDLLAQSVHIAHVFMKIKFEKKVPTKAEFMKAGEAILFLQDKFFGRKPFSLMDIEMQRKAAREMFVDTGDTIKITQQLKDMLRVYSGIPSDIANFNNAVINLEHQYFRILRQRNECGYAMSVQMFFTDERNKIMMEAAKPIPYFTAFDPAPEVHFIHALCAHPQKKGIITLVNRCFFEDFMALLVTDFFHGLHYGHAPKKCQNCGRYFLMQDGRHRKYCSGKDPKDKKGRGCRQVAASLGREKKERAENHPVKRVYTTRLNTIAKHRRNGDITPKFAEAAKTIAKNRRDRALMDLDYANALYAKEMAQEAIYSATKDQLEA